MKHIIDIIKPYEYRVDFSEAMIVDFNASTYLPDKLGFTVWGATLLLAPEILRQELWGEAPHDWSPFAHDMSDDMYVSGVGTVRLSKLTGGKIQVYYYDPIKDGNLTTTVKCRDGSELVQERIWTPNGLQGNDEYLWECPIAWPYGWANLWLYSDGGTVTYEFDDKDMVPATDYIFNTKKYGYPHH